MLILYGTHGCHLCDSAEQLLLQVQAARGIVWHYNDIALQPELVAKYGQSIPVLKKTTGQELCWPFSLLDIQEFVAG